MRFFGLEITKAKALESAAPDPWYRVSEPFTGAWQRGQEITAEGALANETVFACISLIASDVAKLAPQMIRRAGNVNTPVSDVQRINILLRRPNPYQNWYQFAENWALSKLTTGNTYSLKVRGERGTVQALHVLDPQRVTPLVSDSGDVFYRLSADRLARIADGDEGSITVPASEMIHDRANCLHHPLIGVSPLFAAATAAGHGIEIQRQASQFFRNGAHPSGIITVPEEITSAQADATKARWRQSFSGSNAGDVAVMGGDAKYQPITLTAEATQLVEQLGMTQAAVCRAFRVPGYKVGVGNAPTYNGAEAANAVYYSDCLQSYIESFEACLSQGIGLADNESIQLDLAGLSRTDSQTRIGNLTQLVNGSILSTNEARARENLPPVEGGDTIWRQQQDHSIQALAARDAAGGLLPQPAPTESPEDEAKSLAAMVAKELMNDG